MPNEYAEALHELVQVKVEQRGLKLPSRQRVERGLRSSTSWTPLRRACRREGRPRSVMPSAAGWAKNPHPRNWGGHQRAPSQPGQGGHCIRRSKESPVAGRGRALVRSVLLSARWGARTRFKRPVRILVPQPKHAYRTMPLTVAWRSITWCGLINRADASRKADPALPTAHANTAAPKAGTRTPARTPCPTATAPARAPGPRAAAPCTAASASPGSANATNIFNG